MAAGTGELRSIDHIVILKNLFEDKPKNSGHLKRSFTQNLESWHHLLILMSFQICMT